MGSQGSPVQLFLVLIYRSMYGGFCPIVPRHAYDVLHVGMFCFFELGTALHAAKLLELRERLSDIYSWVFVPGFEMTSSLRLEELCPSLRSRFLGVIVVSFAEASPAFAEDVKRLLCVWLPLFVLLANVAVVDVFRRSVLKTSKPVSIRFLVSVFESQQIGFSVTMLL